MPSDGKPYCQICMNADNITLLAYSPKHPVEKPFNGWGANGQTRTEIVTPMVRYRCGGGRRHDMEHVAWVDVSPSWPAPPDLAIEYYEP